MMLKGPVVQSGHGSPSGMSYFEQSVYAIEEFILMRKKLGKFLDDKYFLALTAASPNYNYKTEAS